MKYIIHRGITSKYNQENSYLAIKKALLDSKSSGVEFDIRLTKDKKIVLSHNSLIELNNIENMNYKEIIKNKYLTTLDKVLDIYSNKIFLIDRTKAIKLLPSLHGDGFLFHRDCNQSSPQT